jgi:polyisoprenoid-binding protein YceI
MSRLVLSATLGLVLGLGAVASAAAQAPAPAAAPAGPSKDPMAAPAGTYKIDKNHQSVIARVPHGGGYSYSTVRFNASEGSLTWDPARLEASSVNITVDLKPNFAPIVYNVAPDAPNLMNVAQFPTATFVSTGVRRTGPTTGVVTGNLTLMGQTKPATIEATLVGAGKNARGMPIVGVSGVMKIKRSDFGFTAMLPAIGDNVEILLDAEFNGPTPPAA